MNLEADRRMLLTGGALVAAGLGLAACAKEPAMRTAQVTPLSGYAPIDGIRVYYEVHGGPLTLDTTPLVLLHGGMLAIETGFPNGFIDRFAAKRPVIAIEQQGHGHTGDRPGTITIELMLNDTAGVLKHLNVSRAHFMGHSMGGMITTGMAIRHPDLVASATPMAAGYTLEGYLPELVLMQRDPTHQPSPELVPLLPTEADFNSWQEHYKRANPNPDGMMGVLERMNTMLANWPGWTESELAGIRAPVLVMIGDNDFIRVEHAAEMTRMIPGSWLSVLPDTMHMTLLDRGDWIQSMFEARVA